MQKASACATELPKFHTHQALPDSLRDEHNTYEVLPTSSYTLGHYQATLVNR